MRVTIDMIPYGFNNRITKETLVRITGQNERDVRRQLSELSEQYPLCLSSHWSGVFRPLPGERKYVEACRKETYSRGKNVFRRMKAYNAFLEDDLQPSLPVVEGAL